MGFKRLRFLCSFATAFLSLLVYGPLSIAQNSADYSNILITAQPEELLTQSWAIPTLTNPAAVAGDTTFVRIRAGARLDYLGSRRSPKDFFAAADAPFKLMGKYIGAGLVVNSNSYDIYRNLSIGTQGSYKFMLGKGVLSVGVQLGYFRASYKGTQLELNINGTGGNPNGPAGGGNNPSTDGNQTRDEELIPGEGDSGAGNEGSGDSGGDDNEPDDLDMPTQDMAGGALDVAVGLRYEHPAFYVGVSALHLTNSEIKLKKENESATDLQYLRYKVPMTLYFEAGGNIAFKNSLISLQPSLSMLSDFKDIQGVAVVRATYNQRFSLGFNYRYNRAAGVLASINIKNFFLGYNWEYDYKWHPKGSTGNHELVLGYKFKLESGGKNNFSHRSIRIM